MYSDTSPFSIPWFPYGEKFKSIRQNSYVYVPTKQKSFRKATALFLFLKQSDEKPLFVGALAKLGRFEVRSGVAATPLRRKTLKPQREENKSDLGVFKLKQRRTDL